MTLGGPRYEVLGRVFRGRTTSLYIARMTDSTGASCIVAAKRLQRERTFDKSCVAALSQEARFGGLVQHDNVVRTVDLAFIDGALSVIVEYVEGESLAALVDSAWAAGESIPVPFALSIAHDVVCGLEAVHDARAEDGVPLSLVHRDVSPHNVVVGLDGRARLTDFGLAGTSEELVDPHRRQGTSAYLTPEELLGELLTQRLDVYSAGMMLWELLANRRLQGSHEAAMTADDILAGHVEAPSLFNPAVPFELDDIVMRAIAPDPAARYASASEFRAALEPWLGQDDDEVGAWVGRLTAGRIESIRGLLRSAEQESNGGTWAEASARTRAWENGGQASSAAPSERAVVMSVEPRSRGSRVPPAFVAAVALPIVFACVVGVMLRPAHPPAAEAPAAEFVAPPTEAEPIPPPPEPAPTYVEAAVAQPGLAPPVAAMQVPTPVASYAPPPAQLRPQSTPAVRPAHRKAAPPPNPFKATPTPSAPPTPAPAPASPDDSRSTRDYR